MIGLGVFGVLVRGEYFEAYFLYYLTNKILFKILHGHY